jgi:putative Ca2+/H+ antiporter (TMEM165/GDT1 family)
VVHVELRNAAQGETNGTAVYLGERLVEKVSLTVVHRVAASMFLLLGLWQLWELWNGG